ncbi:MAG: PAS domain-containing protein [Porphyrobacter sp.]|nr:PAS domain-containing protein [Porphyrobacter sp.]
MSADFSASGDSVFRAAFHSFPAPACLLEPVGKKGEGSRDWRYVACTDEMRAFVGGEDITGQTLHERVPEAAGRWCANCERVLESGRSETIREPGFRDSRMFEITLSPIACECRDVLIAKLRDVSSEHAAQQQRRLADTRYEALFNAIDEGFCVIEVLFDDAGKGIDYRFLEANHAFAEHTGLTDPVGKRIREIQPDIEHYWAETYGRIARSGTPERFESHSPAMGRWFDVFAFPVGEQAPHRVGILFEDIGERKRMEFALRHSENRLHSLIAATSDLIFRMNPECTEMQELGGEGLQSSRSETRDWVEAFVPDSDRAEVREVLASGIRRRAPLQMEHRVVKPDGSTAWLHSRAVPVIDEEGEITEWFGMATDITERREVEEQLSHGAQMLRVASEIGKVGLWDWNVRTGDLTWSDEHFRMEGFEVGEVDPSYEIWLKRLHPEDRATSEAKIARAMETGEEYINEYRVIHPDGEIRWLSARGRFLYDAKGKPVRMLGAMIDTTERRREEEWNKLLVLELQHRVRNLIGMVRSVARLSAPSHRHVDEYVDHLIGRLQAMGRTQGTLTRSPGTKVDLAELVREELLVHAARPDQCVVEGPEVALSPHAAEIVTLAVHELATNSIKYGALGDRGHIRINWTRDERDGQEWVALRWQETSPAQRPKTMRKGFGRRLIEERVPYELRGTGSLRVHDTGVLAELEFPLVEGGSILETRTDRLDRI